MMDDDDDDSIAAGRGILFSDLTSTTVFPLRGKPNLSCL